MITQPNNATVCEGGTAVFICQMGSLDTTMSTVDAKWERIRTDLANDSVNITINTQGVVRIRVINSNNHQGTLTSALKIDNVRASDMGPYWCVLITGELTIASNVAFLNISNGMYVYNLIYVVKTLR